MKASMAKDRPIWIAFVLALVLLLVGCSDGASTKDGEIAGDLAIATIVPMSTFAPMQAPALTGPQLDATKQTWPDNEQARMDAAKTQVALNELNNVPTRVRPPYSTPRPQDTPGPGLGECEGGDPHFSLRSCWAGKLGDEFIGVFSGALSEHSSQGALLISTTLHGKMGPTVTILRPSNWVISKSPMSTCRCLLSLLQMQQPLLLDSYSI